MNAKTISRKAQQWGTLTALGVLTVAPVLSATRSAEAAPPVRYGQGQRQNLTGIVTNDLAGREFRMRSSDGRSFRVVIDEGREPRALSRNDRVRVSGYFTTRDSDLFIAESLSILNNTSGGNRPPYYGGNRPRYHGGNRAPYYGGNRAPYYGNNRDPYYGRGNYGRGNYGRGNRGQQISVTGIVTNDLAGREFQMRSNDRRSFRVVIDEGREPRSLSRNDRVRVSGYFTSRDSDLFIAESVSILNNANGGWNNRRDYPRGGYDYPRGGNYPRGGYGYPGSGSGYPGGANGRVSFTGTVANIDSSTKLWIRAYNGNTYEVITNNPISRAITVGDTVQVSGWGTTDSLRADRVTLVRNNRR